MAQRLACWTRNPRAHGSNPPTAKSKSNEWIWSVLLEQNTVSTNKHEYICIQYHFEERNKIFFFHYIYFHYVLYDYEKIIHITKGNLNVTHFYNRFNINVFIHISVLFNPCFYYFYIPHLWPFSKRKFNLKSDRVNLVAPASHIECLL